MNFNEAALFNLGHFLSKYSTMSHDDINEKFDPVSISAQKSGFPTSPVYSWLNK